MASSGPHEAGARRHRRIGEGGPRDVPTHPDLHPELRHQESRAGAFLAVGLIMTGHAILTPVLMVIIMLTGDLLGMSLTTDNVQPSPTPNAWRIGQLTIAGVFMGVSELVFCTAVLALA